MDLNYEIRRSCAEDTWQIQRLIYNCFGDRNNKDPFSGIEDGRYRVAVHNGLVIAMTGISNSSDYNGWEVDWTCTDQQYRGQGIMHALFKEELACVPVDVDVYCSCWAVGEDAHIHLKYLMQDFGFEEVLHARVSWVSTDHDDICYRGCIMRKGERCTCREDLYVRKSIT